jgi:outer membrane lipoprotein SlyB
MHRSVLLAALLAIGSSVFSPEAVRADDDEHHFQRYHSRSTNTWARRPVSAQRKADTNSCVEGSVLGGLVGAGAGAAVTKGDNRWIDIPIGAAAGALVGCQIDGG